MSPRKVRLLVDLVRGQMALAAIQQLQFAHKAAAKPILVLIESAVANARNNHGMKPETLKIEKIAVDSGHTLHRWMPRAMGRATPVRHRTSAITLILSGEGDGKKVETVQGETMAEEKSTDEKATETTVPDAAAPTIRSRKKATDVGAVVGKKTVTTKRRHGIVKKGP